MTLASVAPSRALAEVCDKVRPRWNPSDGPVTQLQDAYFTLSNPYALALIALPLVLLALGWRKTACVLGGLPILLAVLMGSDARELDDVTVFAIQEGCIAALPWVSVTLLAMVGALPLVLFLNQKRLKKP